MEKQYLVLVQIYGMDERLRCERTRTGISVAAYDRRRVGSIFVYRDLLENTMTMALRRKRRPALAKLPAASLFQV
jgi:hypothetical protein